MTITRTHAFWAAAFAGLLFLAGSARLVAEEHKNESQLIEILRTGEPADKALACKHLATLGTKASVPELARLLRDERLASWARIALEAIPDPAADEALRAALPDLQGKLLIGAINSIGVRRDAAAVDALAKTLNHSDVEVASAAAVSLGHIASDAATEVLRQSLNRSAGPLQDAVAEGCILCAERLMNVDRTREATEIYDAVRKANIGRQRKLEAVRGAILARKAEGVPLLIEQLRSPDRMLYQIGLTTAREIPGPEASKALANELARTSHERAIAVLAVLADRRDPSVLPAVVVAAKGDNKQVRIAALGVVGKLGDASSLPALLDIAAEEDAAVADSAKAAIVALEDQRVNGEIAKRLNSADGKPLVVLLDLVGQRRIAATDLLTGRLDHSDAAVRAAALAALGAVVEPNRLAVLIAQAVQPKHAEDADAALRALRSACLRMPDRDACAAELATALPKATLATKAQLVEILGAVGGAKSLETIGLALQSHEAPLLDAGTRALGEWMSSDAAPVLLDLAKSAVEDKYRIRALRGYIRIARQFAMPDPQRAEMCQTAIDSASRPDEQKLALAVLERYPNRDTLKVAVKATQSPALRKEARRVALAIADKLGDEGAKVREALAQADEEPLRLDIVKAEYGAGSSQIDVTQTLQKCAGDIPLIMLPSPTYNDSFGADPAPGTEKILKVQYRINGKPGDASFPENALIALPMPK